MKNIFLIISTIFGFSTFIIGIYSIIKGHFRPQRMTRFLLLLNSILFVGTLFAQGDRNAIYLALIYFLGSLVIFILSLKTGIGGTTKLDVTILFMAIISLIVWYTTKNPVLGLVMSIVTDIISVYPTIIKAWILPETEEWRCYLTEVLASSFNILSLSVFTFGKIVYPLYIWIINAVIVLIIVLRQKQLKHK